MSERSFSDFVARSMFYFSSSIREFMDKEVLYDFQFFCCIYYRVFLGVYVSTSVEIDFPHSLLVQIIHYHKVIIFSKAFFFFVVRLLFDIIYICNWKSVIFKFIYAKSAFSIFFFENSDLKKFILRFPLLAS